MRSFSKVAGFALAAALLAGSAAAQFDTNGPNAALTVNGRVAGVHDPVNHDVPVALPGVFTMQITTGVNAISPLVLLGSLTQPAPGSGYPAPLPWGGSIDIGVFSMGLPTQVFIIGNGLSPATPLDAFFSSDDGANGNPPTFTLAYGVTTFLAGSHISMQAIVVDPTNPLFPLDNTEAADANFFLGQDLVLQTGDDGVIEVPFALGHTFDFHGQSYTSTWVDANGLVTFGGPTFNTFTWGIDTAVWATDVPSIAGLMADWSPQLGTLGGVHFFQAGTFCEISWEGVPHSFGVDQNDFSIVLELSDGVNPNAGNFGVRWQNLDPTAAFHLGSGTTGHTPGPGASNVVDTDLNVVQVSSAGDAQFEEHEAVQFNNVSLVGYDGFGTKRNYNDITTNKNGRLVDFIPNGFVTTPGDLGYTAIPMGAQPNDVTGLFGVPSVSDAGGEFKYISGAFEGFTIGGAVSSIVFDPSGMAIPASATYRYGDPGAPAGATPPNPAQVRTHQMLEFVTPSLTGLAGPTIVRITFEDGSFQNVSVNVTAPGTYATTYTGLFDDQIVLHLLNGPITWYGVPHAQISMSTNGPVMFGLAPFAPYVDSDTGLVDGFDVGLPGAAAAWADFNGSTNSSTFQVFEDTLLGTLQVTYTNVTEFATGLQFGSLTTVFGAVGPDSVFFDYSGWSVGSGHNSFSMGVSDGSGGSGSSTLLTNGLGTGFATAQSGAYQSSTAGATLPDSLGEFFPGGTGNPATLFPSGLNIVNLGGGDLVVF